MRGQLQRSVPGVCVRGGSAVPAAAVCAAAGLDRGAFRAGRPRGRWYSGAVAVRRLRGKVLRLVEPVNWEEEAADPAGAPGPSSAPWQDRLRLRADYLSVQRGRGMEPGLVV